jgi:hypothetical protein
LALAAGDLRSFSRSPLGGLGLLDGLGLVGLDGLVVQDDLTGQDATDEGVALLALEPKLVRPGAIANTNPRCLLAIEVVFSGSSKHIMGDTLNAGALGLYGLVVGTDKLMPKIKRIGKYLEILAALEKLPPMFRNVHALSTTEFEQLFP